MCSSTDWGQNVRNRGQTTDQWPSWPMVPCELCQQHYQPSHQDSLCGQNLAISLSFKVKRGSFFYKSSSKNSISINMWEYVYFRCTPDTPAQLAMWCRVAKTLHAQPGPTNSKDALDLSVKSIIEKTVKGFEIDILTLETCVACIYNEVNPYLYSLLFSQTNGHDMLIIHSWPEIPLYD